MDMPLPFPPNSLHPVYRKSPYPVFPIQHYQPFFCRPMTSSSSIFSIYPRLVTFHLRRWSRLWPHCPDSRHLSSDSSWPPRVLIEYTCLPSHGQSFLLSPTFDSMALASIWRISLPESTALN